ncbi:hypothetical protein HNQ69_000788 [Bartonella callosciuri]|uniref:Uncharacterized protein n=1 Tax=Bartonella callosciuri TaxID=686223 RepID=A0A840NWK5_9HYPH|nr:hypothetical protein [Bartonella callosciuri]
MNVMFAVFWAIVMINLDKGGVLLFERASFQ